MYTQVQRLFKVEVDGTECRLVWHRTGEVFLQLDSELVLEWANATQDERVEILLLNYGDLVAEHLASWVADVLPE